MSAIDPDATLPPPQRSAHALPDGTRLAEFEVQGVIGEGGFGIVYLAWDHMLHRRVAVKEYMPLSLASRGSGTHVIARTGKAADDFGLGLRSFINEAQLLASFDHPSLLKVHRFWEDNGTAYMAMPYYRGITLKRALAALPAPPEEGWLLDQLRQLLDALELMHDASCFHRDISPDNILLLEDGIPLLLDFGAARRVIGDSTKALTAFLKPGYAPVEQYAEVPQMKQGPWTDLYALASVVHYAITGHTPPEAVVRLITDSKAPLGRTVMGRYSERFLGAIDHALAVRPEDRPQSVAAMRAELGLPPPAVQRRGGGEIPTAPAPLDVLLPAEADAAAPPIEPSPRPTVRPRRVALVGSVAIAGLAALTVAAWWIASAPPAPATSPPVPAARAPAPLRHDAQMNPGAPPAPAAATPVAGDEPPPASAAAAASVPAPTPVQGAPAPAAPIAATPAPRPIPKLNAPDPRCGEIIARVTLGETLTDAERAILQKECRR